jgi:hypothetical protein
MKKILKLIWDNEAQYRKLAIKNSEEIGSVSYFV